MNCYLVRLTEEKELVGIFCCKRSWLAKLVDECTNPSACEYAAIGAGSVFWHGAAPKVPVCIENDLGDDEDKFEAAHPLSFEPSFSELWLKSLCYGRRFTKGSSTKLVWRQVEEDADALDDEDAA